MCSRDGRCSGIDPTQWNGQNLFTLPFHWIRVLIDNGMLVIDLVDVAELS